MCLEMINTSVGLSWPFDKNIVLEKYLGDFDCLNEGKKLKY